MLLESKYGPTLLTWLTFDLLDQCMAEFFFFFWEECMAELVYKGR